MKEVTIGIILVVGGSIILGWFIKEAYKNNKNESTKYKIFYLLWVTLGVVLDFSNGLIIILGLILLGVLLIIYSPLFS
ncbi:hypothetical protein M3610_27105 [Neobacillus sp. MER 74]|uniref:hypothetical protein n=1 Tax=Neobacillus sp. MER 74 TaxID=2939566 RepID=UPI0020425B16|nr:hypothetical protein [Neobacillus sp. MER 74]MCM3118847.1 hypothetical protein [Neobacillus sp. MER 74]